MKALEFGPVRSAAANSTTSASAAPEDFFAAMVAAVENKRRHQRQNRPFGQLEAHPPGDAEICRALHFLEANKPSE